MFPQLPFTPGTSKVTGFSSDKGKRFTDKDGRVFRLVQLSTALQGDVGTDGDVYVFESDNVVTNVPASAEDTTYRRAAGVAQGTVAESSASETYFDLILVDGDDDAVKCAAAVVAGDGLVTGSTSGQAERLDKTHDIGTTTLDWGNLQAALIGIARAAVSGGFVKATVKISG